MTTLHKAALAALEALENHAGNYKLTDAQANAHIKVVNDLRTELAQEPAQPSANEAQDQNTRIVSVTSEGVSFGDAWFSHEFITGQSAKILNAGGSGVTAKQYMKWLNAAPPAVQPKRLTDEQVSKLCKCGPVYAPDGIIKRTPIQYRNELENAMFRGFRLGESAALGEKP